MHSILPVVLHPGFTAHALIPAGYFSIIGLINIFPAAKTYGCNMNPPSKEAGIKEADTGRKMGTLGRNARN